MVIDEFSPGTLRNVSVKINSSRSLRSTFWSSEPRVETTAKKILLTLWVVKGGIADAPHFLDKIDDFYLELRILGENSQNSTSGETVEKVSEIKIRC